MSVAAFLKTHDLLGDRTRLAIMATLAASREPVDFSTLVGSLEVTRGNLSAHMQKLEQAGLVEISKEFVERKPRTSYRCTKQGLREVEDYLKKLDSMLSLARNRK